MDNTEIIRTLVLRVNGKMAEDRMKSLSDKADGIRTRLAELDKLYQKRGLTKEEKDEHTKLLKDLKETNNEIRRLGTTSDEVAAALDNLSGQSVKELRRTLTQLNKVMASGTVERGSKEWDALAEAIRKTKEEIYKVNQQTKFTKSVLTDGSGLSGFGQKWGGLATVYTGVMDLVDRATAKMEQYVEAWSSIDAAMTGVEKYTGLARAEVEALNEELRKLDTTTSIEGLNALAADAGRLGITSRQQILDFVEAADQINVALGEDLGEGAVKNIGKIAQLFGDADRMGLKQAMLSTGSVINELAQSSSASEGYLMEFTARLAGVGRQAGLTQAQVMGFASVLDQGMVGVEKGATAMQNVLTLLNSKTAELAGVAGLNVKEFTQLLRTDANEAVLQFIEALNSQGGFDALAQKLTEMHMSGSGVTQTLSTLANNIEALRATQQQAAQAFAEGTSVTNEFDKANGTVEARLKKLRGEMEQHRAQIGQRLLPVYYSLLAGTNSLVGFAVSLAGAIRNNAAAFVALASTAAAYTVVANLALVRTKALAVAHAAYNAVCTAGTRMLATWRAAVLICTSAVNALRGNTVRAAAAQRMLNASMLANPYAAVVAAVVALVAGIALLLSRTRELTAEQRAALQLQKDNLAVQKKANEDTAQQQSRIRLLTAIIHDNNRSLAERQNAIRQLRAIVPGYNAEISRTGQITRENTKAVQDYIAELRQMAAAQAAARQLTDIQAESNNYELALQGWRNAVSLRKQRLAEFEQQNKKMWEVVKGIPAGNAWALTGEAAEVYWGHSNLERSYKYAVSRVDYYGRLLQQNNARANNLAKIAAKNAATAFDATVSAAGEVSPAPQPAAAPAPSSTQAPAAEAAEAARQAALRDIEQRYAAEQAAQKAALAARIISQEEYNANSTELQFQQIDEEAQLYEEGTKEMAALQVRRADLMLKQQKEQRDFSARDIDIKEQEALDAARARYIQGLTTAEQYEQEQTDTKLEYLRRRLALQEEYGNKEEAEKLRRQIKTAEDQKQLEEQNNFWKKVQQFRTEYLKESDEKLLDDKRAFAKKLLDMGLLTAEEYALILEQLKEKPEAADLGGTGGEWAAAFDSLMDGLARLRDRIREGKADWTDYARTASAALSTVGTFAASFSQYYQAQQSAETAKVTARYDKEIEAAGQGTKRAKRLEEQKQKELAKIKTKYAKKQMQMEIAQAIATTAQNAIAAFGSQLVKGQPWTLALAIAAAGLATAQGALQIAIIRKQHEAQAAGYYEGGYTRGTRYRRQAGIVHEGEFVANHLAVQNPAVRPVLDLIDSAQRSGTISTLTPLDVSRAVAAPAYTSATARTLAAQPAAAPAVTVQAPPAVVVREDSRTAEALQRLNDALEEGIRASVSIDGRDGLDRQWRRWQEMKKRT